jgi:Mn-dependent DtxR family transcriptional regulator
MNLQESGEMYLESILVLSKKKDRVRSIDVVEYMGFSKPSVSRAIGLLRGGGYVNMDADGYLTLTEEGLEVASKIYERHSLLSSFLISLGVSEKTADADACKIEHHISDESFAAIKQYVDETKENSK